MIKVELVSHCYSAVFSHYASALCYQLSSFILYRQRYPSNIEVVATICCTKEDIRTRKVLAWYDLERLKYHGLSLNVYYLEPSFLGRRAIGRNIVAKKSKSDIVWFADVDQVYKNGCLDDLAEMDWPRDSVMVYPKKIKIHKDHAIGDKATSLVENDPKLVDINIDDFVDKRYGKAIGGVQIVQGDFARKHGYLQNNHKWQKPTNGEFVACRCDIPYRRYCKEYGEITGIDLLGMYRIRHTEAAHGRPPKV